MPRGDKPTTAALALKDGWIYEDALPANLSKEQYDCWFRESLVLDGVRMGPPLPPDRAWIKLLSNGELVAYRTDIRGKHFDGRPVYEFTRVSAASTAPVVDDLADVLQNYINEVRERFVGKRDDMNSRTALAFMNELEQLLLNYQINRHAPAAASPAAPQEDVPCPFSPDSELYWPPATPTPSQPARDAARNAAQAVSEAIINGLPEDNIDKITAIIARHLPAAAETVGERANELAEARRLLSQCCYEIQSLADQQAMPDESFNVTLKAISGFLEGSTGFNDARSTLAQKVLEQIDATAVTDTSLVPARPRGPQEVKDDITNALRELFQREGAEVRL